MSVIVTTEGKDCCNGRQVPSLKSAVGRRWNRWCTLAAAWPAEAAVVAASAKDLRESAAGMAHSDTAAAFGVVVAVEHKLDAEARSVTCADSGSCSPS